MQEFCECTDTVECGSCGAEVCTELYTGSPFKEHKKTHYGFCDYCNCDKTDYCDVCETRVCSNLSDPQYSFHERKHKKSCRKGRASRRKSVKSKGVTKQDIEENEEREPVRRKKPKEEKESDKEIESSSEEAGKIDKKRKRESKGTSNSSRQKCEKVNIFSDWEKHKPQKPTAETKKQIAVLNKLAVNRKGCTCFVGEDEKLKKLCYDTEIEAKKIILSEVELLQSQKSQKCSAFSILEKDGKYLILITNSCHSKAEDEIDEKEKTIRPAVEPDKKDFPFLLKGTKPVIYSFSSCDKCNEEDVSDSLVFSIGEKKITKAKFRVTFTKELKEKELTEFTPEKPNQISLSDKVHPIVTKRFKEKKCRTVFAKKIQPNKTAAEEQSQQGWSLHHSEMECFVFAKRRGWKIVAIYIDRDCCPVCASTLNGVDKKVYSAISSFYALKKELKGSEKEEQQDEKKEMDESDN